MGLSLLFAVSLALGGAAESERPTQACSSALIAELQMLRGEWKAAEQSLRYALIFDFEDRYLRERLRVVMLQQGLAIAKNNISSKKRVRLHLPPRLTLPMTGRLEQKPIAPSVAEK
jgi:hypothetical protein